MPGYNMPGVPNMMRGPGGMGGRGGRGSDRAGGARWWAEVAIALPLEVLRILQLRQVRLRLEKFVQSLAVAVAPLCGGIRVPERGC